MANSSLPALVRRVAPRPLARGNVAPNSAGTNAVDPVFAPKSYTRDIGYIGETRVLISDNQGQ